jgi:aryl-alcohol dehydrogenase-like predicted oxidoreductase
LTGKYNQGVPEGSRATLENMSWMQGTLTHERLAIVEELGLIADQLGVKLAQLAIAWVLRRKVVSSVITGASRVSQLMENLKADQVLPLMTGDILEKIDQILGPHPIA